MFRSIRSQITLLSVVAALLIAAMGALGLYTVRDLLVTQQATTVNAIAMRNHMQADMMHEGLRGDVFAGRLAMVSGDARGLEQARKFQADHGKEMLETFLANEKVALGERTAAAVQTVKPRVQAYVDAAHEVLATMSRDGAAESDAKVAAFVKRFEQLEVDLGTLRDNLESDVRDAQAAAEASSGRASMLVVLVTLAMVVVAGAVAVRVTQGITGPLRTLQAVAERVNQGDMQARVKSDRSDELGQFANAFDRLLDERIAQLSQAAAENERLNNSAIAILEAVNRLSQRDLTVRAPVTEDVIGTVSDSLNMLTEETSRVLHGVTALADQVAQVSGKVRSQAELVSRTAEDERAGVEQMIDALADAAQTMNQVAALAEQSNISAAEATQVTHTALETVDGTVRGMESIRETIAETEKRIKRLGERSQEISGIVNLINTISERTHVLALNASMQAAVAGDAGRGFAVVAEEVQRLAESSRNATQQIGTLVANIQLETNETIATVNRTIGQVVQGSALAQRAGEQMRHTQQITGQLVAQVQRIGDASERQKAMSGELLASVQRIGQSTERTAQQIDAQNVETETLLSSARRLVDSVNVFKLPQLA